MSDHPGLDGAYVSTSSFAPWSDAALAAARAAELNLRTWGDGYGYVLVATGRMEAMVDPVAAYYDLAPMPVILAEAGGRFTDLEGLEGPGHGSGIATNGPIHDDLLALLGGNAAPGRHRPRLNKSRGGRLQSSWRTRAAVGLALGRCGAWRRGGAAWRRAYTRVGTRVALDGQRLGQPGGQPVAGLGPVAGLRALVGRHHPHLGAEPGQQPGPLTGTEARRAGDVEAQLGPGVRRVGVLAARTARRVEAPAQLSLGDHQPPPHPHALVAHPAPPSAGSASAAGATAPARSARARATRERIVPIGQPHTSAASA